MPLSNKLEKIEQEALEALKLDSFKGLNLIDIKDKLTSMLAHIGTNGMFTEYTKHDISHVNGMLKLAETIIPENTWKTLTPTDWLLLVLSIYFHDLGMLITDAEFTNRTNNKEFQKYLNTLNHPSQEGQTNIHDRAIYQDYVREFHGERIYEWIANAWNTPSEEDYVVQSLIHQMIGCLKPNILKDLALLCKSHQLNMNECVNILKPDLQYEQDASSFTNLLYVAAILRTADLLHITSERTPDIDFLLISPQNNYSRREWVKQKSVHCIRVKQEANRNNINDSSIEKHRFEILATFDDEEAYSQLQAYLDYAEKELIKTYKCCADSNRIKGNNYYFPWDGIDRTNIETNGFNAEKLKFELDKDNILKLLIGHTLYSHANVVLRELTQNAIDACRLMKSLKKQGSNNQFKVLISWDSNKRELIVSDNGTGMNEHIILNFLFKVGVSRYQSSEFKEKHQKFHSISRFGIGLLTCFMISDEIDITTRYYEEKLAHSIKIRNLQGEFYLRNDAKGDNIIGNDHGTTLVLKVRKDVELKDIERDLKKWIIVSEIDVTLTIDKRDISIGYKDEITAMKTSLADYGVNVDDKTYKIKEYNENGAAFLILLHKNEIYNYWTYATPTTLIGNNNVILGTCIEGIMVENTTPGYNNHSYIALLNCKGENAPSTNVARDRLEDTNELRNIQAFVYRSYFDIIREQINVLCGRFNISWSIYEVSYTIDKLASYQREYYNLSNRNIFEECFRKEKFMLLDNAEKCELVSITELPNKVWTIESQAYSSAFSLVQEIKDCAKTPLKIVQEILPTLSDSKNVLADNLWFHYSSEMFLSEYQISDISFDIENRRIDFCWLRNGNFWNIVKLPNNSSRNRMRKFFILNESASVEIGNTNNENIIVSKLGVFLFGDNALRSFLNNLATNNVSQVKNALSIISDFISRVVRSEHIQIEQYFDKYFNSDDNFLHNDLWAIVDKSIFFEIMKNFEIKKVDFNKYYSRSGTAW